MATQRVSRAGDARDHNSALAAIHLNTYADRRRTNYRKRKKKSPAGRGGSLGEADVPVTGNASAW
jgi:hypothetical protein